MGEKRRHIPYASRFEPPTSKYRARRCPGAWGRVYDSEREAAYSWTLFARYQAKEIATVDCQKSITLFVNDIPIRPEGGKRNATAIVDFLLTFPEGRQEIHEVKGYQNDKDPITRLWRLKLGIIKIMWPDVPIVIVT